jgi:two-component system chemotaxis sensor kinase CheA
VSVDKLDRLLDIVGEIAVARGRMTDMLESRTEQVRSVLLESHREADLLYMDLQELAMKLRMVPLGPLFHEYVRAVRDTAIASGKSARLFIEGDDVEVDTAVVEHLRDPLMHLVRNAVHHGIEDSLRRTEVGKPAVGRVVLRAERRGGSILVEVSDDGAGLDRERIASIARERGLVGTGELTNAEIDRLILLPGFSTAQEVTELSGRGVGMDVVVRNIETLRGSITVDSTPGQGSTFSLHLPLTLAIIEGFRIAVADEVYVVPMESVVECVELPRRDRRDKLAWGVTELRGTPLPYIDLRRTFGLPGETPARESLLVVRRDEREAGIAVDELLGSAQVVIKPLGRLFQRVSGLSGTAIMGNGRPAFVLDIPALLDGVLRRFSEWSQGQKEQRMAHEALHE